MNTKPLTAAQHILLRAILNSQYWDGAPIEERISGMTWTSDVLDSFSNASRGGILAKAEEAGLIRLDIVTPAQKRKGDSDAIGITQLGYDSLIAADKALEAAVKPSLEAAVIKAQMDTIELPTPDTTAQVAAYHEAQVDARLAAAPESYSKDIAAAGRTIRITVRKDGLTTVCATDGAAPQNIAKTPEEAAKLVAGSVTGRSLGIVRKWITLLARNYSRNLS
jgi:hypothetical protein